MFALFVRVVRRFVDDLDFEIRYRERMYESYRAAPGRDFQTIYHAAISEMLQAVRAYETA